MNDPWKDNPVQANRKSDNRTLLIVARIWCGFMGFESFFGQLYFGRFDWSLTISGVSGLLVGVVANKDTRVRLIKNNLILTCCLLGIAGIIYGTFEYYIYFDSPGNYYAWSLHYSFVGAFLIIGYLRIKQKYA